MGDLPQWPEPGRSACAVIVPSRGRPGHMAELLGLFEDRSVCSDLIVCLDADDPAVQQYTVLLQTARLTRGRLLWHTGRRAGLVAWTNRVAKKYAPVYEALVSLGDDHQPVTAGWDGELLEAARAMGGGWAYGDDGLQHENLPTAFLVSASIVTALGWMLLPDCQHMFVDAAARDLADACGRRAYLPGVSVRHLHYTSGLSALDQTYSDAYLSWAPDEMAYRKWLGDPPGTGPIKDDADTVRGALGG